MIAFRSVTFGQISPGDLSQSHSQLEGMSNCTKCHNIGAQLRNNECLACHSDISKLQNEKRGYHSNAEVLRKNCFDCHSEHHGRKFRIINFNEKNFDHNKTGFGLTGKHTKLNCSDCHKTDFISDEKIKKHKNTFMGLRQTCNACHTDFHQSTLGGNCEKCHTTESFRPAPKFNHTNTNFALTGAHSKVECAKCHTIETKNGKKFQNFKGIAFSSCNPCHEDFHKGKFGNKCSSCHVTESFKTIKNIDNFDHNKTNYPLAGKHTEVKCLDCHKGGLNVKPKFEKCISCHSDYHKGDFVKNNLQTDCSACHDVGGFTFTSFTIERHAKSNFKLEGSHLAIPCQSCHQKNEKWKFKIDDVRCIACHKNVHGSSISKKMMKDDNCELCHSTENWSSVNFDHKQTRFELLGAHKKQDCKKCHTSKNLDTGIKISFSTKSECLVCHKDIHVGQFTKNGIVDCERCHHFDNWKPDRFDHNKTSFLLEGAHLKQPCYKCHKQVVDEKGKYIKYKFGEVKCALCHS